MATQPDDRPSTEVLLRFAQRRLAGVAVGGVLVGADRRVLELVGVLLARGVLDGVALDGRLVLVVTVVLCFDWHTGGAKRLNRPYQLINKFPPGEYVVQHSDKRDSRYKRKGLDGKPTRNYSGSSVAK